MAELRVWRDHPLACEMVDGDSRPTDLAEGEAQLLIERFGLTSNNVSYAALGDQLGYWRAFPAPREGWGRVPAWGYARAVASRSPALAEGQFVFGLVPMASYVTVRPGPHSSGFIDTAPHRAPLAPVYNQYVWASPEGDDAELIMRPLFGTSVLLDLVLSEAGLFGADTIVLTSASAKTAYGLAYLLREGPAATIGLTSRPRRPWVERLGLYGAVFAYDELDDVAPAGRVVLVDFTDDRSLMRALHERLAEQLVRSISVGFTHWRGRGDDDPLPGPAPQFFFTPDEMSRRGRELAQRYVAAWQGFASVLEWSLRLERVTDGDGLVRAWRELVEGRMDPAKGYVVSLDH